MDQNHLDCLKDWSGGSCRDITFSKLDRLKAENAIAWIYNKYQIIKLDSILLDETISINPMDFFNESYQYMHIIAENSTEPIKRIQFLISPETSDSYFVELTFFPEDIDSGDDILKRLNEWFDNMDNTIKPKEYYVRDESPCWIFGDTNEYSGVIFYRK
jgi:hypothetical protein